MKDNLQIIAEYLGVKIADINPDQKITVADANMLMTLYAKQYKDKIANLERQLDDAWSYGPDE